MSKAYYIATVREFLADSREKIVGCLNGILEFDREIDQQVAWEEEVAILKQTLGSRTEWQEGAILFEYSIPRLCGRIDVVVLLGQTIFVLEFKAGEKNYPEEAKKQVLEYCLDLKYFHKASENLQIVPVLVCTKAKRDMHLVKGIWEKIRGIECCRGVSGLVDVFSRWGNVMEPQLSAEEWLNAKYSPTPTIIEAAIALYEHHDVKDITKASDDENATNLTKATSRIKEIIAEAQKHTGRRSAL